LRAPGRAVALIVLAFAALSYAADPYLLSELRDRGFDAMQRIWPRTMDRPQVLIVGIDEGSLKQLGQWPWPRTLVAELVERIAACKPLVLGVDVIFAEPDRLSPPQLPNFVPNLPSAVIAALSALPSSEATLAQAIAGVPTVLGMAPSDADSAPAPSGPHRAFPIVQKGGSPDPFLATHRSMIHSLPEIARAARSEASLGVELDDDGTVRNVPLASLVAGNLVPSLALEMIRVAAHVPTIVVTTDRSGISGVALGSMQIPTDAHGRAYLHFERPLDRDVAASELLGPNFDSRRLAGHIVILAVTGLGLLDQKATPLGLMQGADIHSQLIESILAGTLLYRPPGALWFELALILVAGLLVIGVIGYQRPFVASAGMLGIVMLLVGTEAGLFRFAGWLLDSLYASGVTLIEFGTMLGGNFVAEQRERRRIAAELERQREADARLEGELTAARAIQMGLLPLHFPAFPDRAEIDLYARIEPARDVGGDLFDFQLIDRDHLFFMIGDVSGKGIPAALFMAMTKEVIRDAAARHAAAPDRVLAEASAKIGAASDNMAEDGANMMFVTAFAGLLDLATGDLVYCNAGHDAPLVLMEGRQPRELTTEGGPPLGTVDDFPYPLSRDRLESGAIVLLYTDGITEAQNDGATLYTSRRLLDCLATVPSESARAVIDSVFEDLSRFVGAAEQADDITLLGIRWLALSR
jgi:serine phosphatase RsbU (regulator of sigma subunit)